MRDSERYAASKFIREKELWGTTPVEGGVKEAGLSKGEAEPHRSQNKGQHIVSAWMAF